MQKFKNDGNLSKKKRFLPFFEKKKKENFYLVEVQYTANDVRNMWKQYF